MAIAASQPLPHICAHSCAAPQLQHTVPLLNGKTSGSERGRHDHRTCAQKWCHAQRELRSHVSGQNSLFSACDQTLQRSHPACTGLHASPQTLAQDAGTSHAAWLMLFRAAACPSAVQLASITNGCSCLIHNPAASCSALTQYWQARRSCIHQTHFLGSARRGSATRRVRSYCSRASLICCLLCSSTSAD